MMMRDQLTGELLLAHAAITRPAGGDPYRARPAGAAVPALSPHHAEIARECLMPVNTVQAHLKNTCAKLGVSARAGTVHRARLLDLL